jgi:Tfp pilus assembly protein FimT
MSFRRHRSGYSAVELLVAIAIGAAIFGIGVSTLQGIRNDWAFSSASQETRALLNRARWIAINSGRAVTSVALIGSTTLQVQAGGTVLASADLADRFVTITATNLPYDIDSRGFLSGAVPTITLSGTRIARTETISVDALGRVL